jgi:hypothetical protein
MPRGLVEAVEPEFGSMDEEPAVRDAYRTWSESRQAWSLAIGHVARQDRPAKIQ